ncbi:MAG: hypothetical protein OXH79_04110 [Boseongicola sp.]|nr:hypothetical protein [Boseongicola sp.]
MAHPNHHAESSARKFGGVPCDYHAIHDWFDASKAHEALPVHRALRHHSHGIFEAQQIFGRSLVNSDGREVPVRFVAEQHVREDCRRIPSVSDWLRCIPVASWMVNGVILPDSEPVAPDNQADWRASVAAGQTILGFADWLADREARERTVAARIGS